MVILIAPAGDGWEEIGSSGEIIHWDTLGMRVIGRLISIIDVVGINGRPSQEATVATAEGNKRFYLTTDLQQKLSSVPIGNEVKIEFMGEVRTMRGTMMKNFKVKSHKPKAVDSIDSML